MSDNIKMTQTEAANRCFLERVQQIPNITVHVTGGETLVEQSFLVDVPTLRSEEADRVYELEGDIYRAYPKARTYVRVRGRKELTGISNVAFDVTGEGMGKE